MSTIQASSLFCGCSITRTPADQQLVATANGEDWYQDFVLNRFVPTDDVARVAATVQSTRMGGDLGALAAALLRHSSALLAVRDEVAGSGDDVRTDVERVRDGGRPVAFTTNDSLLAPNPDVDDGTLPQGDDAGPTSTLLRPPGAALLSQPL